LKVCLDLRAVTPGAAGIGAFARSAAEALVGHDGDHQFLAVVHRSAADAFKPAANVQVLVAGDNWAWSEIELPALIEEHRIDALFSPLFSCPVVRSARHVITLHDVFPESHPELCTQEFLDFWQHRIGPSLRSTCHAVAVSEWSKGLAAEKLKLSPERVSVVRQSVSPSFRPLEPEHVAPTLAKYGIRGGGYVLYVGALDPRKNLDRLLGAFLRLSSNDLTLVIVGRAVAAGYDPAASAQQLGLGERVKFLGRVSEEDLPALYSGARCFAFPSLAEGFGRPPVEAMACGVPVVASNRTALPETCGNAALLPDAENAAAIADALQAACFDDLVRERLIAAGRARAAEFTSDRFAADLLAAFEAALAGPKEGLWPG